MRLLKPALTQLNSRSAIFKNLYPEKYLQNANVGEKNLNYLLPILQQVELSDEDYYRLVEYCEKKDITFMCSAFDEDSADFVDSLGVPAFKTASADLINLPLFEHLVQKGKPIIASTGMSRWDEVVTTVEFLKERQASLHCCIVTVPIQLRLVISICDSWNAYESLVYQWDTLGHERGIAVSTVASALGACIIERHITLDRTMDGPDHAASLEPQGFSKMLRDIRQVDEAMGTR